jgi:hypothetical protein
LRSTAGGWTGDTIQVTKAITVRPGNASIVFDVVMPEDYKAFPDLPTRLLFSVNDGESHQLVDRPQAFPVKWKVPTAARSESSTIPWQQARI